MPAIRALVLDFGGVISRTMFETHTQTEAALGLKPGSLQWRGPFDPANDAPWRQMQAGQISERDYWLLRAFETGQLLGEDWRDMQTLVQRARGADPDQVARPETLSLMQDAVKAGIRLAILSNELDLFYGAALRLRMQALRDVEAIVDATYTGILKPDARAYHDVSQQLGLPLEACLFVDDQPRNVEGALMCGMPALYFDVTQPGQSCAQARRLIGVV